MNLTGRKADVKREEIENILKMKIFARIPADENQMLSCLNEGVPIVLKNPRHVISHAFSELTNDLIKVIQDSKTKQQAEARSETTEMLKKSSKLG